MLGLLVGGALPGVITKKEDGEDYDGDLIAGCMTAGMWGGFALGIVLVISCSIRVSGTSPRPLAGLPGFRPPSRRGLPHRAPWA